MYASNLIARLYKLRSPNVRVVNHIHGLGTWIKPPHILLDRFLLFGVDKIVVVSKKSKEIREKREKYPKSKLSILYNSLDCSVYQSSPSVLRSSNAIVLGMACRLVELKQVNLCIRMLSNLNKEGLNITLKIAGDGPEKEKLVHLSESLGLANKVEFLGYVKDMQDFYRSIDCLVVCSRTEDLPLSIVESFAVGKHAISTNVGSISELFEKTDGLLVQDIEADFSIIFDYLKHGEIISESKANRKFASQYFDIKIHTTNLEKIYAELLNS
jgi:glycosyltransferase involved in cell wall biosynthesis